MMDYDSETWIIETGGDVAEKRAEHGPESLTDTENAIYCLWVVDYAVRNSGTLEPVREIHPSASESLREMSQRYGWKTALSALSDNHGEAELCDVYYEKFEDVCGEIRAAHKST